MSEFGELHAIDGNRDIEVEDLRGDIVFPVSGSKTLLTVKPYTPSVGNLWGQPGVRRDDDDQPHYAVPLVGTTAERVTVLEHGDRTFALDVERTIRKGFIW